MIIGLSGYIGSGKDTVAKMIQFLIADNLHYGRSEKWNEQQLFLNQLDEYLEVNSSWQIRKFAGKLKQMVSLLTGIPVADLEKEEVKSMVLGLEWDVWTVQTLQDGTKVGKPLGRFTTGQEAADAATRWRISYQWEASLEAKLVTIPMTVRQLLQRLGTDAMRDVVHPNIHVNALFADYKAVRTPSLGGGFGTAIKDVESGKFIVPENPLYPKRVWGSIISDKKFVWYDEPNWIISDVRFPNESQAIKDRGGIVIRVNRPQIVRTHRSMTEFKDEVFDSTNPNHSALKQANDLRHPSETSLDNWEFDAVINNDGTLEDLLNSTKEVLKQFNILT